MASVPGTRFGAYEITGPLGAGGMGEVYRAKDTTLEREVALKLLPEAFAADAGRVARFEQEAKTLAALNHPNIAQIHGLERSDGATAIVMELVEGTTLAERIVQGPIPADEALGIAYQIIDALEAAHEKQIVHRDLKPANVKLTTKGTVKVLDFGIAKVLETRGISGPQAPSLTTPAMTQAGILLGTAAYMSPEQARGKPVDRRADIWAFGCLLYEMLTGQPAFGGEDVPITLARVLAHGTDMASLPGAISSAIRHTIAMCLEKDPKKRIADINDVRLALQGKFETPLAQAPQSTPVQPMWRRALLITAAVFIAGVGAWLAAGIRNAPEPPQVRRSLFTIPADQPLNVPAIPMIAISPDGSEIAYAAGGGLYRRRLSELEGQLIPGTAGDQPIVPAYSPDGQALLYGSITDTELKRVPVEGGTPLPIYAGAPPYGWRWSTQETIHYGDGCGIFALPANGGTPELVVDEAGVNCYEPALLPGGEALIFEQRPQGAGSTQADVAAYSFATGEKTTLFPGKQPTFVEPGYLTYFDPTLGLMARAFDPATLEYGNPVGLVDGILMLTAGGGVQFRVSPSGTLVYVRGAVAEAGGGRWLGIMEAGGSTSPLALGGGEYRFPSVSPDGSRVAVQIGAGEDANIFVYDLSGETEIRQLTFEGNSQTPTWTPDGEWIAYASTRAGALGIYRRRADGSGVAEALTEAAEDEVHVHPAWAPDGRLAYTGADEAGGVAIWAVSLPDGTAERLVGGDGNQGAATFSPDGRAFAYGSDSSGTWEIYAEPYPPDGSRIRVSEAGTTGRWPVWSRGGARLYFQLGNGALAAIDIDTRPFAIRNRYVLPQSIPTGQRNVDSIPGSDQILVASLATQQSGNALAATEIVIVENWIEEVKARVPRE